MPAALYSRARRARGRACRSWIHIFSVQRDTPMNGVRPSIRPPFSRRISRPGRFSRLTRRASCATPSRDLNSTPSEPDSRLLHPRSSPKSTRKRSCLVRDRIHFARPRALSRRRSSSPPTEFISVFLVCTRSFKCQVSKGHRE